MPEIKNGGLDGQFGSGPFEQQQFWTAGVEGVKMFHFFLSSFLAQLCFEIGLFCSPAHEQELWLLLIFEYIGGNDD